MLAALSVALVGSMMLSYALFRQGSEYYRQLNGVRLDPLGLSHYGGENGLLDSTTAGRISVAFFGDSRAADWPAPDLEQFEFMNRGIDSETSAQALLRFDAHVAPIRPDIIVIQVGINDLKAIPVLAEEREAIVANCEANIQMIVERSMGLGAKVILTTVFPTGRIPPLRRPFWSDDVGVALQEVNTFIRSLAGDDVIVFDAYPLLVGSNGRIRPEYSADLLHLSAGGYRRLNDALVPLLNQAAGR